MNVAGIDVGSKELVLVIRKSGKAGKASTFSNEPQGHQKLLKVLRKAEVEKVCVEATGAYHIDVAVVLSDSPELALMVVNPKAAKHYAEARMTRLKNDPVDASLLAEFAEHMPFEPWKRPNDAILAIRAYARRLAALTKQRAQTKNQLHAWRISKTTPEFIIEDVELSIQQLETQIDRLRQQSLRLIQVDTLLNEAFNLMTSTKGIAEASAIQLLGELLSLPDDMTARQWVAMAGLDPRQHQSGSSVNKPARISKAGNRYLRAALYMPALCASRYDPYVKAYYQHLINDRGLKKIQAVCAVMRKLLHAIHGMLKHRKAFDGSRFYRIECTAV